MGSQVGFSSSRLGNGFALTLRLKGWFPSNYVEHVLPTPEAKPRAAVDAGSGSKEASSVQLHGYWSSHSLLPHPVLTLDDVEAAGKSSGKSCHANPGDRVILQVIEAYCPPGSTFKKKAAAQPSASPAAASSGTSEEAAHDEFVANVVKVLTEEVRVLKREMQQMKIELECLADAVRREKEQRKRLEKLALLSRDTSQEALRQKSQRLIPDDSLEPSS